MVKSNPSTSIQMLPLLPLRDTVVFPLIRMPLLVGREPSLAAVRDSMDNHEHTLLIVAQKDTDVDDPKPKDVYGVGVVAKIVQNNSLPDDSLSVIVEAEEIVALHDVTQSADGILRAAFSIIPTEIESSTELLALQRTLLEQFYEYLQLMGRVFEDMPMDVLRSNDDPEWVTNFIITFLDVPIENKQVLLEQASLRERMHRTNVRLQQEIDVVSMQNKIMGDVRNQMEKTQKEYILHEQMKAISKELGEKEASPNDEVQEFQKQLEQADLPQEGSDYVQKEIRKLSQMVPYSPEAAMIRNYVELALSLPWASQSEPQLDSHKALNILEEKHYGLKDPKERILEYISVAKLNPQSKGSILCLVGPPGVGKTSLVQSMAKAMGRSFVRISLGGVRDEAEIRGHRKTYIGAMPGKIIQALRRAQVNNPLILLDEVDKMAHEFQGDPAAALLEVLDPEQNHHFEDHYLDLGFDLSHVIFIATANSEYDIPYALHDRMEMIRLEGYTELDKLKIVKKFLVSKQLKMNGLVPLKDSDVKRPEIVWEDESLLQVIRCYTREAGVRELDRKIAKAFRKIARQLVNEELKRKRKITIKPKDLVSYLGLAPFSYDEAHKKSRVGVVMGLAWTAVGGDILPIEATRMKGKDRLMLTGQLGDVMQESAQTALSYLRTHAKKFKLDPEFYDQYELHIHAPEGAIPKDGPSAGITLTCVLYSVLSQKPMPADIAMTGEVTLTGRVLRIGGLKSKSLAAMRSGIRIVILPEDNRRDYNELPNEVKEAIDFVFVRDVSQVLKRCFDL